MALQAIAMFSTPNLIKNVIQKVGSEFIGRAATFVVGLIIANRLGEVRFGHYSYALAVGFVLAQLADLGLQLVMMREVAGAGWAARGFVQMAFWFKCWLALLVAGLVVAAAVSRPEPTQFAFICLGLSLLAQTFLEFVAHLWRGLGLIRQDIRLLTFSRLLTALLVVIALAIGGGLSGVGLVSLLAVSGPAVWGIQQLFKTGWLRRPMGVPAGQSARQLIQQTLPLGLATFLSIGYTRLAIFLLEHRLGEVAVAQYSAALRLVEPTQIIPAAILAPIFPVFIQASRQDPGRARQLALLTIAFLAFTGLIIVAFFWFGATAIIHFLYPATFSPAIEILRYLGLSVPLAYVNYMLTYILIARKQQHFSTLFMAAMLLLHATLSWRLIATLGVMAPAISVVVAEFFLLLCCLATLAFVRNPHLSEPNPL